MNVRIYGAQQDEALRESDNDGSMDNGGTYRQTTTADWQSIFVTCRSTMVDGHLKKGIFRDLSSQLGFERKTVARQ
jgi:hypothetical protein